MKKIPLNLSKVIIGCNVDTDSLPHNKGKGRQNPDECMIKTKNYRL